MLPLLAILWNSAFRWIFLSFSPLPFALTPPFPGLPQHLHLHAKQITLFDNHLFTYLFPAGRCVPKREGPLDSHSQTPSTTRFPPQSLRHSCTPWQSVKEGRKVSSLFIRFRNLFSHLFQHWLVPTLLVYAAN